MQYVIYECRKLAQREYKRGHDTVAKLVRWKLCEKHNLVRKEKWYEHCPEGIVEDDDVKLLWCSVAYAERTQRETCSSFDSLITTKSFHKLQHV